MIDAPRKLLNYVVPEAGLEPAQGCPYRILSPARLPFHHSGTVAKPFTKRSRPRPRTENFLCYRRRKFTLPVFFTSFK